MENVTHIQTATGISDLVKSGQLMSTLQTQLKASLTPDQYLIDICHVLINQQHQALTNIATNILHQLGECAAIKSNDILCTVCILLIITLLNRSVCWCS